jgi:hypothetical protein
MPLTGIVVVSCTCSNVLNAQATTSPAYNKCDVCSTCDTVSVTRTLSNSSAMATKQLRSLHFMYSAHFRRIYELAFNVGAGQLLAYEIHTMRHFHTVVLTALLQVFVNPHSSQVYIILGLVVLLYVSCTAERQSTAGPRRTTPSAEVTRARVRTHTYNER